MKSKKLFYLTLFFIGFVFSVLMISLNKDTYYKNEQLVTKNILNFSSSELFSNQKFEFADIGNKKEFIILNIWASWCTPCRTEHKILSEIGNFNNVELIGLNYKDKIENAKMFVNELGNPYDLILTDPKGLIAIEFGAYGVPETYIIDNKNKKILKKYIGPINDNILSEIKTFLEL